MGDIVDLQGKRIGARSNEGKITQTQAAAIIVSEIDIAIETWNKRAVEAAGGDATKADLFTISFDKYEYDQTAKESSGKFGYAELSITLVQTKGTKKTRKKVYSHGVNFVKEQELNNTNGYYPSMVIDCIGFLISAGLLYNLAISQEDAKESKKPRNAKVQSGDSNKNKPGTGDTGGTDKADNGLPG